MDAIRFDAVSKFFADRRLSRRQALAQGGAGLAASALVASGLTAVSAQEATPSVPTPDAEHGPTMLFLQSFQSGSIVPKEGEEGRYTVTLEHGLGQTIYFSDRPDRIVGASPTPQFLEGLGFPDDNPPNAALVVDNAAGETDIAVVELFSPHYDEASNTVTYDVTLLQEWEQTLELGFAEVPADLAQLPAQFGAAHLFIEDCATFDIVCTADPDDFDVRTNTPRVGYISSSDFDGFCYSWGVGTCLPCSPWFSGSRGWDLARWYWSDQCNQRFSDCRGNCFAWGVCLGCSSDLA